MFGGIKQFGQQGAAVAKLAILQRKIMSKKIEKEEEGVKAVVSGDGKLKYLSIDGVEQKTAVKIINEAIAEAQADSAEIMKGAMGDLSKVLGAMPK